MSVSASPDEIFSAMDAGGEEPVESQESTVEISEQEVESTDDNSLSSDFLQGIEDEAIRQQLEPYVKKWDAGVTRRFQELHQQYDPYSQLGTPEELAAARQLFDYINNDPHGFYNALAESLGITPQQAQQVAQQAAQQQQQPQAQQPQGQPQQQEIPPYLTKFQQDMEQQRKVLTKLAEFVIGQQKSVREQQENQEFEKYLSNLRTEFGEFDEEYVLTKMANGMSGEDAIKAYKQIVQAQINQVQTNQPSVPATLSGGAAVPQDQPNVAELSSKEVKDLVTQVISGS